MSLLRRPLLWHDTFTRRWPWIGNDGEEENGQMTWWRYTIVLPFPFPIRPVYGQREYKSLVIGLTCHKPSKEDLS